MPGILGSYADFNRNAAQAQMKQAQAEPLQTTQQHPAYKVPDFSQQSPFKDLTEQDHARRDFDKARGAAAYKAAQAASNEAGCGTLEQSTNAPTAIDRLRDQLNYHSERAEAAKRVLNMLNSDCEFSRYLALALSGLA